MATIRTTCNPVMLVWAREEVGYSVEQAAEAIGMSVDSLRRAEAGESQLTLNQLRSAAKGYNFPYGYFYLANPPGEHKFKRIPDYRVDPELTFMDHPRLHLEIKKARDRRSAFLEIVQALDDATLEFHPVPGEF